MMNGPKGDERAPQRLADQLCVVANEYNETRDHERKKLLESEVQKHYERIFAMDAFRQAGVPWTQPALVVVEAPGGNCDGSRKYAYDATKEDGRGAKLPTRCPGCRACR